MSAPYRLIVTSHTNPSLSGVAKFNRILAGQWGIPSLGWNDAGRVEEGPVLLSYKLSDATPADLTRVEALWRRLNGSRVSADVFFHSYSGLPIEDAIAKGAGRVFCANAEIRHALAGTGANLVQAWCPGLIDPARVVTVNSLNLFSFGMAHKIEVHHYRRLEELLKKHHEEFSLWVSTAFHEKVGFGDFDSISAELDQIFGPRIQILGFLSDDAVNYFVDKAEVFVSFIAKGVRANNTSVFAAMGRGKTVLTNRDQFSPDWLRHGVNMLDVAQAEPDDFRHERLREIGAAARRDVRRWAAWEGLRDLLAARESVPAPQ